MNARPAAIIADLGELASIAPPGSRPWTVEGEDLRATLMVLGPGEELATHTNREADLVLYGVGGSGTLRIGEEEHALGPGIIMHIPKGLARALRAGPTGRLAVLAVHRRTAVSSSWRWRPRRRRAWEDPWDEIEAEAAAARRAEVAAARALEEHDARSEDPGSP